jgi:hypothetical protein
MAQTIIPFELLKLEQDSYHLFVPGIVNGYPCRVLIDTGASKTVFDRGYLASHEAQIVLKENEKLSSGLGTNTMKSETAFISTFSLGERTITDYEAAVLDLAHVNNSYAQLGLEPVHAILGNDILAKYKAVIDYGKKVMKLR